MSGWSLTGNSGTTYGTDFIGTTDGQNLLFKVNGVQSGLIEFSHGNGSYPNTGLGYGVLRNSTGDGNTAMGYYSLPNNTSGTFNTAIGVQSLLQNSTGEGNTATGAGALQNSTGDDNIASGFECLLSNTTGSGNTAVGENSLEGNSTGSNNTALGYNAGVVTVDLTNATAIGYNAIVGASSSLVLGGTGGDAVNVGIGTTTPSGVLDVVSTTGALIVPRMTTAQMNNLPLIKGSIIYNTDDDNFYHYNGSWTSF
jgi:hypothetical protein